MNVRAAAPPPRWLVHGSLVLVQVLFGLHYLAIKVVLREIAAPAWALVRVGAAALLLLPAARLLGRRLPSSPAVLGRLALYALFGVVINQLCYAAGMARTTATHASILMTSIPVATLLLAVLARRERLAPGTLVALGVATGGVLLVVRPGAGDLTAATLTGDVLILINALSYSLFLVLSKRLLGRIDPLAGTAVLLGFGALGMLAPGLPALLRVDPRGLSASTWLLGALIVVFPTAIAYLLTYWALSHTESSVVAFFIYLQPLIATALAAPLLGERPAPATLAGGALICAGVWLVLRR